VSNIIGGGGGDSEWTVDGNGNLVPKDGEPVSIEYARIDDTAHQFIPASDFASSGDGTADSFYQGGLQEAHDATIDANNPKPVKAVLVDGRFNDTITISEYSAHRLMGWTWGSNIENTSQVLTVETTDVVVDTLWLKKSDFTGAVAAVSSASGATEEFHGYDIEVENGATGLLIDGTDRCKLVNIMCQDSDEYGFELIGSNYSNVTNLQSQNTVKIDGASHCSLTNITVEQSNSNGDARGLLVTDNTTDCFISGTVTNAHGNGVTVGGSRNVFVGQAYANATSSADEFDINFTTGATECVALGYFANTSADLTNWGTRCVVNGMSVNNGDPSSTGDWNGFANTAAQLGVTVWDTATSPETPYRATPTGSWVAI
jgi:hypothetical protein